MTKVIGRVEKRLGRQLNREEIKGSLTEVKQTLLFIRRWLWFQMTRNRLLFWIGVTNLSLLLGASVALLTPIFWGDRSNLKQLSADNSQLRSNAFLSNGLPYQISRPVNILVMGIEPHPGASNSSPTFTGSSDTMLLVRLNPDRKSIRVLSIPKDSQVTLPNGLGKISNANSLGGATIAARVVSRTLNNVPIDRYVTITTNALQQLVDQLGGVEIFVPQPMSYQDVTQKLQIDLDQGWQTLNGEQAEQFARFRASSSSGDLDRVQRQQLLLKALRDRLTSPAVLPRLPQITRIAQTLVKSNLSPEEMLAIANFTVTLNPENLQMLLLPGDLSPFSKDPNSYWLYTPGQDQIMSKYFGTFTIGSAQKPKALTSLKIAVQNASGKPKFSQQVANYLKSKGFENVYIVSDWSDEQRQTQIIAQKGNVDAATNLQKVLEGGNIEADATGDLNSSLTIRVGKDWNSNTQPFQNSNDDNSYGWKWGEGSKR